jgi:hypothetical protein
VPAAMADNSMALVSCLPNTTYDYGESADNYSGRSVSSAGDMNGDGLDDLIVSAWAADLSDKTTKGKVKTQKIQKKHFITTISLGNSML